MGFIAVEDLVGNMTPEQKIFVSEFYAKFNNNSAAHKRILNVEPLYYIGSTAGSEFLTYAATKLYIGLSVQGGGKGTDYTAANNISFFDEANSLVLFYGGKNAPYWDAVTAVPKYVATVFEIKNIWFSRVSEIGFVDQIIFSGYRITLN